MAARTGSVRKFHEGFLFGRRRATVPKTAPVLTATMAEIEAMIAVSHLTAQERNHLVCALYRREREWKAAPIARVAGATRSGGSVDEWGHWSPKEPRYELVAEVAGAKAAEVGE